MPKKTSKAESRFVPLAHDEQGKPFAFPADATQWRVLWIPAERAGAGAPKAYLDANGKQLYLSADATEADFEAACEDFGLYRLWPVDDAGERVGHLAGVYRLSPEEPQNLEPAEKEHLASDPLTARNALELVNRLLTAIEKRDAHIDKLFGAIAQSFASVTDAIAARAVSAEQRNAALGAAAPAAPADEDEVLGKLSNGVLEQLVADVSKQMSPLISAKIASALTNLTENKPTPSNGA